MTTGADLKAIRERKPLVHQITNYVVMNETANATLALGALPVMAHALQEVEEMASAASALVLNIGTLSDDWVEAMLLAGRAANRAGAPVVLDPVGAGATSYRTETSRRLLAELDVAVVRGNSAEIATLAGRRPRSAASRRSAAPAAQSWPAKRLVRWAASPGHGPGRPRLGRRADDCRLERPRAPRTVTGTGCMSTAITGCFLAFGPDDPLEAAAEALVAFGVAGEEAAKKAKGPGSFHVGLYDALYALDPDKLDKQAKLE